MDPATIIALMATIEDMDSSSSSDDDEMFLISLVDEVCKTETHAKIRDYVDNVVLEYSDIDVSIVFSYLRKRNN